MAISDSELWDLIGNVMAYSVDSTARMNLRLGDKAIGSINEDVFLRDLYAVRELERFEESLLYQLMNSSALVCVAGGRGCGKTSTIHYVVQQIKEKYRDVLVILLDIKSLYGHISSGINRDNAQAKLSELTRRVIQGEVFPSHSGVIEFTAWLLAGPPDETDPVESMQLSQFSDLSHEIASEAAAFAGSRTERCQQLREFFLKDNRRFGEIWRLVSSNLNSVHVVLASVHLKRYRRAVVFYDNVDRIPADLQPYLLMVANDFNNSVSHACTTAIAIRKENIRRPPGGGDGGDYIQIMSLGDEEYPKVLMPRVGLNHARSVLEKRYEFTNRAIKVLAEGELTSEVALKVAALHSGILGEFNASSIHALANESLRNIASIYIGFVRYLRALAARLGLDYGSLVDPATTEDRHLRTLFFLWLKEEGKNHGVVLYEILKTKDYDAEVSAFSDVASEHHLLMSCIHNLTTSTKEDGGRQYPTISSVFERMRDLGFTAARIKRAIVQMCAAPSEQPKILEFLRAEFDINKIDENSDELLGLTVLGDELISSVYSAVGYVWGQAYHDESSPRVRSKSYHEMSTEERMDILYGYIEKLAGSHIKLLALLRDLWLPRYGDSWLDRYRKNFGVGKRLLVERVIESAVAFYSPRFLRSNHPFISLREAYAKLLSGLRERVPAKELDFAILSQGRASIKQRR